MAGNFEARAGTELAELFEPGRVVGDDRALLDRFRRDGSPSAFEGLVVRHGGLVRGVCRRVLGDGPDADDAFQATFLVLARRAGEVRDPDRLGPWLYGVAVRVALKARTRRARRREVTFDPGRFDRPERTQHSPELGEIMAILDAELARVAPKLRDAVVLCLVEGTTVEEAATRLACPVGTVKSRLARGRVALQTRLIRRGIAPGLASTALAAPLASADAAVSASASTPLIRATLALALAPAASVAPTVAALARGVAPTMLTRFTAAASALVLGGCALAGTYLVAAPQDPIPPEEAVAPGPKPAPAGPDPAAVSRRHLRQICLAVHNFISSDPESRFPAPAIFGPDGKPLLSWRVALLPVMGEQALYNEFHRDEPWDSPHNKALIARMPAVFESPDSPAPPGTTRFRGYGGPGTPGTMFEALGRVSDLPGPMGAPSGATQARGTGGVDTATERLGGVPLSAVTDGTRHTVLLAQTTEPIFWTKPGELPGPASPSFPNLDGKKWRLAMADGGVVDIMPTALDTLWAMITRNGGEIVPQLAEPERVDPRRAPPGSAQTNPTSTTALPAAPEPDRPATQSSENSADSKMTGIEERLRRVEEKLDRLIQRIEANDGRPKK